MPTEKDTTRVLLIDDDPADQELARLALAKSQRARYDVTVADRLTIGEERLRQEDFDVVLLDLGLPDSFGLQTLDRVRRLARQAPIVVLTDLSDEEAALESLDRGAQDYLPKQDLAVVGLCRAIQYAIQRFHMHQQLTQANEQLQKNNERLSLLCETAQRFVDNVSHEFRTPLTVIKEYVSLLREGVVGQAQLDVEQCRFLDVVADRADDLNTMVDDMLDVSKLESGLLGAWRKNCRIRQVIDHVRPSLEKKAGVKDVALQLTLDENLPEVYCDPEKIGRVIINLAVNAIKFCGQPGRVQLFATVDEGGKDVVVGVTDNGAGIDESGLKEIFQRFRQLGTQPRGTSKGFGLGLNIARELVELNFGELRVTSRIGAGSTFSFTIPIADPLEILARFLERARSAEQTNLALVTARIEEQIDQALATEVDAALHYIQLGNSLIVRTGPHRWLLALADIDPSEFLKKFDESVAATNRNRPHEPLPVVEMEINGSWDITQHGQDLLHAAEQLLREETVAHV